VAEMLSDQKFDYFALSGVNPDKIRWTKSQHSSVCLHNYLW